MDAIIKLTTHNELVLCVDCVDNFYTLEQSVSIQYGFEGIVNNATCESCGCNECCNLIESLRPGILSDWGYMWWDY